MSDSTPPNVRTVASVWWPLAASWLLMAMEIPAASAVIARLPQPEIQLAAFGGIVFPVLLLIESPIIMLLAASTALTRDWDSYLKLRRFMMVSGALLTGVHVAIAFTPLYDFIAHRVIDAPSEIIEPARLGIMVSIPWTWSIAYRRFNQGILIRLGRTRTISAGTALRLAASWTVLGVGYSVGSIAGVVLGTGAIIAGVATESAFIGWRFQRFIHEIQAAPPTGDSLTALGFSKFYVPLAMTSMLWMIVQPLGSAAMSRMPHALESLAAWPVVFGLLFILRSPGVAYKEVVVAMLDRPGALRALRRFTLILGAGAVALSVLVAATPLAGFWFEKVSGLVPSLSALGRTGVWFGILLPVFGVLQNWYVGILVHSRRTRAVIESVVLFLASCVALLWAGVAWSGSPGLFIGLGAFSLGGLVQLAWVWKRSRPALRALGVATPRSRAKDSL